MHKDIGGSLVVGTPEELSQDFIVILYLQFAFLYLFFGFFNVLILARKSNLQSADLLMKLRLRNTFLLRKAFHIVEALLVKFQFLLS